MKPCKPNAEPLKRPSRAVLVRTVASSTAIETGQPITKLERTLLDQTSKFRHLKLAD